MKNKIIIISVISILAGVMLGTFLKYAYVPPILMYHSVGDTDNITKLSVSPENFERQMKFLKDNRYNVITLEKMAGYIREGKRPPYKSIAITFDDGYYNNYQYAYPVLKKSDLPATIFIIVSKIGLPGWLGWKELKEMSDSGLVTIGSHTVMHHWLPAVGTEVLKHELGDSKAILENNLGKPVNLFCYPLGVYNDRVKRFVKEAGYGCAVTSNMGQYEKGIDVYSIKRIKISRTSDNLFVFWFETSGYYAWLKGRVK